jgi:hypothetical protein
VEFGAVAFIANDRRLAARLNVTFCD